MLLYKNASFALLDGWNETKTSFNHAGAGMEGSCLWALVGTGSTVIISLLVEQGGRGSTFYSDGVV
jgi:hypothetical protein